MCLSLRWLHRNQPSTIMASRSRADPIVLNFHDSCLRMSDVQLLQGPRWLNDQIISFYLEYLEKVKYKNNPDFLFVAPEVTQCMKLIDDKELRNTFQQLEINKKNFVFFVLNDNETTQAGGTHWSLLVLSKPERTFFHFDSYMNSNSGTSHQFVQTIKDCINCRNYHVKPVRCLQQANSYDCGIHVICMLDNITDYANRYDCVNGVDGLHQDTIRAKRSEMLKLIQSLGGTT